MDRPRGYVTKITIDIMNSIDKGVCTELQCQLDFTKLGYIVSQPIKPCRYDFLIDLEDSIIKVQCKTSRMIDEGSIQFECRSSKKVKSTEFEHRKYLKCEIDYFYTYWDGKGYLIPVQECSTTKKLRFLPPKNGQKTGITFASEYTVEKTLERRK